MKISKTNAKEKFRPIEVTITIESQEELDALEKMTLFNQSIPDLLSCSEDKVIVRAFIDELANVLYRL